MKIWVERPQIDGDRVLFRWRQSEPNPYQLANEFFFRYEGIELSHFSNQLFYEIFLAQQLRVFVGYAKPIEVIFPEPVSSRSIDFWQAFHDANDIILGPAADIERYQPRTAPDPAIRAPKKAAIFYGGGKDSVLALGMLTEIFGNDQVLLIQYIAPMTPTAGAFAMHESRQETMMLEPARAARGVTTQRIYTDFVANFTQVGLPLRPNRQLYTAGALPAMIAWGVEYSTVGDTRHDFPILARPNGKRHYVFPRSRPEMHAALSTHYRRVLGFDHTVTNINFPFTTSQDAALIYKRYSELMSIAVMCTRGNAKQLYCYRCSKCLNWALYGLAAGYVEPRMDYDRVLTEPLAVQRFVNYANQGAELTQHGNAPWFKTLTNTPQTIQPICHSLASGDPERLKGRIGRQARANLYTLIAMFGNTRFENHEIVHQDAIDFTGVDLMKRVGELAAEHYPVKARLPEPWIHGDVDAIIDFQTRMPHAVFDLPHIRA
jgi:hypothetical protein